ncbi:hypothetical protein N5D61_15445 [Pseudomonas sp. GD03842]|nr:MULTISPECIES: hypothetical protein [unclassified Pseudomonas]MDH0747733.1 hypothetical protein [Pseudomonas sp. GD03842]
MNVITYYRSDLGFDWRFSNLRSGQPAASDRSLNGGESALTLTTLCRTPQ